MNLTDIWLELIEANPALACAVYDAFEEGRWIAMDFLRTTAVASTNRIHLPWLAAKCEETLALMGEDFWTYGVDEYSEALNALYRYSAAQHLVPRLSPV